MAFCSLAEGDTQNAVMYCALACKCSLEQGNNFYELDQAALESVMNQCRKELGKAKYESFYKQGEALSLEEILSRLLD
jgi:hypothetical protein